MYRRRVCLTQRGVIRDGFKNENGLEVSLQGWPERKPDRLNEAYRARERKWRRALWAQGTIIYLVWLEWGCERGDELEVHRDNRWCPWRIVSRDVSWPDLEEIWRWEDHVLLLETKTWGEIQLGLRREKGWLKWRFGGNSECTEWVQGHTQIYGQVESQYRNKEFCRGVGAG